MRCEGGSWAGRDGRSVDDMIGHLVNMFGSMVIESFLQQRIYLHPLRL